MKLTPPAGYRALEYGETVLETDFVIWSHERDKINPAGIHAGDTMTRNSNPAMGDTYIFIRPIASAPTGWISVKDRPLTKKGDYETLCIDRDGKTFFQEGPSDTWARTVTHYLILPPAPPKPEIKVGEHKVAFRKDGSIKVGCTEVSSELFEKIAARRKEEMQ